MSVEEVADALTPAETATAAQPPTSLELARGKIDTITADYVNVFVNGATVSEPATVVGGQVIVGQIVEVLVATPRLIVFGSEFVPGDYKMSELWEDQPGWWVADGRSTTDTAQPALANALGKSGTFNIPDRRGKFAVGADGTNYVLGVSGGSTTIAATNLPVTSPWALHDPQHTHVVENLAVEVLLSTLGLDSPGDNKASYSSVVNTDPASTGVTLLTNSGGAQKYNPPYLPIVYLIKL